MELLVDTDIFYKLATGGLFCDALRLLGISLTECGRLPALPYMLRRGHVRRTIGPEMCDALMPIVDEIPVLIQPSNDWLDRLTPIHTIDPGEAQIFAVAAEYGMFVMSGDKRALRALRDVDGFPNALEDRIIVLEAVLIALCNDLGPQEVRQRVRPILDLDVTIRVCFSNLDTNPIEGLRSYFDHVSNELTPLVLWSP